MTRRFWQTLAWKLTLAFALVSALTLGAVGMISNVITRSEFNTFIRDRAREELTLQVQAYVQTTGKVAGFRPFLGGRHDDHVDPPGAKDDQAPPESDRGPYVVLDSQGRTVYAISGTPAGTRLTGERAANAAPVTVNGKAVAFVAPSGIPQRLDSLSQTFLARTTSVILWAMLAATLAAVLMGLLMSRALLAPLRALLRGIHQMQRGEAPTSAPPRRADEFGEVLLAFHAMHSSAVRNQQARRQLTANIAHDLNTPLSVISGTLEAMIDGTFKSTLERLTRLHREAQQVGSLVNDLRFLSLADAGELRLDLKEADLAEVVREAVNGVRELARRKDVRLDVHAPAAGVFARIDARRVTQVMQNLLSNAPGHTPEEGRIEVDVRHQPDRARVLVRDTGAGIAPDKLQFVFDRLYRADEARVEGGSGLGLSISKSIVEGHGGPIGIESTPGQGTTVTFELPLAPAVVKTASPA